MSSEPKAPKALPSAAEINAYVELSAARTRLRLPLAKGNALPATTPSVAAAAPPAAPPAAGAAAPAGRALPVRGQALPTPEEAAPASAPSEAAADAWVPFSDDPER